MSDPVYDITDLVKNQKLLDSQSPESGRLIREDATIVNMADAIVDDAGDGSPAMRITAV